MAVLPLEWQWLAAVAMGAGAIAWLITWLFFRHRVSLLTQQTMQRLAESEQALSLSRHEMLTIERRCDEFRQQLSDLRSELNAERASAQQSREQAASKSQQVLQLESERTQWQADRKQLLATVEENARLNTALEQQRLRMTEQIALLTDAKATLVQEFENTANRIFEDKSQKFSDRSKESLELTLNPLKQQLSDFRKRVDEVYGQEAAERNRLVGQITELQKQTQKISQDAINLTNALKGDNKAQGNWGEVVLERLLEESGLQKGREYETQLAFKSETGNRRNPDVVIRLPEQKDIIIDAKVSLVDYERYCSTDDAEEKKRHLKAHLQSMRAHISGLSFKDYEKLEGVRTLDFIFIFIPVEAAFMLALQEEPGLFREAYDKHIILVSPTTLLATLRTVENIWRYEKQNKNAERIAQQAGGLYDQFCLLLDAFDEVGKAIDRSQDAFTKAQGRLASGRGNLIKRVEDIRKLGAKTKKQLKGALTDSALGAADDIKALEDQAGSELTTENEEVES
ncbi:DNA recombination protein RmuC [Simiduia agarivorans]|uniref:RmuC domain-containing protein family n=1 Tax=Simiduia agarivorans (strain DSM 21679 / JCM 13881 / BCRC 17597 / SA1) TaxID=1117647 RepID=K4KIZ9_SIMAS|nr:DNA recombination protein RmuC [Simiduia agarivorans]AFU97958.1 RmuC domain-containing protein family [Simiduia agarivorans SA1 = DSM 21679]